MTSSPKATTPRSSSLVMRLAVSTAFLVVAAVAAVGVHAQGMRGHGPGGPGMMMFGGSPEHIAHAVDHLLDGLGATDAQRTQIKQIATAAAADLKAQRSGAMSMHQQALQIFTAPTVDARAAEALRQQMSAQHEQASKRMLQALLDVSQVLTPDQRAQIADRFKQREAAMHDRMERLKRDHADRPPQ